MTDETVCPGCAKELEALRKQVAELEGTLRVARDVGDTLRDQDEKRIAYLGGELAAMTKEWKEASRQHNDDMDAMYKHIEALREKAEQAVRRREDEIAELTAHVAFLREALSEASVEISDWGQYASEYFQDKYKLEEVVARYAKIASGG